MTAKEVYTLIKQLAQSKGTYSSILNRLLSMTADAREEALEQIAANCRDSLDMVLFFEG